MGFKEWKEFDPYKIAQMQQTLLIYDRYGNQTAALYSKQNRVYVAHSDIPEYVRKAFLAVEDARFYQHGGIDVIRIIGALAEDLKNGNLRQGGSTISQQLVKNTNLTGAKTLSRKLQEAVMAYKLEQVYSKDKILEMYLNYIPFGNGAYGIEAASEVYFGKRVNELTLAQAAMLAGIIKAPAHYAPDENLKKSVERRNLVLSLMRQQGMITQEQQQKASAEPVTLAEPPKSEVGFFTDMVLYNAEKAISVTSSELLSGGYRIYTTLDQDIQNQAEALFNDAENFPADAEDGEKCEGALVVLDGRLGKSCFGLGN
jgi:membrane peptidoglycan carboxypeptidase